MVAAAVLAVASCASISLEDLEFHAWKLKFGKKKYSLVVFYLNAIYYLVCLQFFFGLCLLTFCFSKNFFSHYFIHLELPEWKVKLVGLTLLV